MKRFSILFLIFLFLTFTIVGLKPAFPVVTTNIYKQGIYTLSDFSPAKDGVYTISNVSATYYMGVIIADEEQNILQDIRLKPNSEKHNTIPIGPNDTVILLGKGEVYINPQELTQWFCFIINYKINNDYKISHYLSEFVVLLHNKNIIFKSKQEIRKDRYKNICQLSIISCFFV